MRRYTVEEKAELIRSQEAEEDTLMVFRNLKEAEDARGVFIRLTIKDKNDIYILAQIPNPPFDEDYMNSVLVHEYSHFLTKKAGFHEEKSKRLDMSMIEAIAYHIQDLWLREHTNHDLLYYYKENDETRKIIKKFSPVVANMLYSVNPSRFIFNSIYYFKDKAPEKFKKVMKGSYSLNPLTGFR